MSNFKSGPCGFDDKPCCLCKHSGCCVAGMNEDEFDYAPREVVRRRLNSIEYLHGNLINPQEKELMLKYVKGEI